MNPPQVLTLQAGELIDLLSSLTQTQLIVTHDLPLALQLCDRSVIVSDGRVVADGPTRVARQCRPVGGTSPRASSWL